MHSFAACFLYSLLTYVSFTLVAVYSCRLFICSSMYIVLFRTHNFWLVFRNVVFLYWFLFSNLAKPLINSTN